MESRPDLPVLGMAPLSPRAEPVSVLRHRWDYRFTRALMRAQTEDWTGTLEVFAEGVSMAIRIREGRPVFVSGGLPVDSLGRVLAQRGWITEMQLAEVVEQRMAIQGRKRFGQVAIELGVLEPEALQAALAQQVGDKLMRCLHWEHGELSMRDGEHEAEPKAGQRLNVEPLVLAAVERHFGRARIDALLSPFDPAPVAIRGKLQRVAQRFQLDATQTAALETALGSPETLAELRGAEMPTAVELLLCALALVDQLEPTQAAPTVTAEPDLADADPVPALADNDQYLGRADRIEARGLRLLLPASPPSPPGAARDGRDKLLADSAFLQGRELLRADEFAAAADAFRTAAALRPGAREYALHAAWAAYLAAGRNERLRARLEAQCRGAVSQDQHLAFAHHVLGQLALEDGEPGMARAAFRRAVQLDPNDDVALENLARLPR